MSVENGKLNFNVNLNLNGNVSLILTLKLKRLQHWQRLQFGERRHMKSVIPQNDLRYSVALCPRYAEKVHRRVGESHEQLYRFCLLLHEKVGMRRNHRSETALSEVEENVLVGIVKVRIETHKHAEAQHKYKVEVGIAALYAVKIDDAFLYKFKQVAVLCLVFCGMNEKLRKKHRYGEFCRREGNGNKSSRKACIAQMLQLHSWAIVKFYVE